MKKSIKWLCVLFVTMLMLTACGTKGEKEKTDSNKQVEKNNEESGLQGKLVYWSMWNQTEPQGMMLDKAIKSFMDKHPGVEVKVQWNGREISKILQPALDNGQVIDIYDQSLDALVKNWKDYNLNLDQYMSQSYESTDGKSYEEAVMGNFIDLARSYSDDGSCYGVPYQPYLFAFMYNKEHFETAGIEKVPTTWKEFVEVCEKLKNKGYEPITTDDAYMETIIGTHLARLKGVEWVEKLVQDKTNAMWDDPAILQMAKQFEELAEEGYFSKTIGSNKFPAGQQDVANGTATMYLNGTWLVNEIMTSTGPDFKWGTFAYPTIEGGTDPITAGTYGAQSFGINKDSKYPDIAFELITHLTTGEWDSKLAKESYGVPVSGDAEWPVQLKEAKAVFNSLDMHYPYGCGIHADNDKLPFIKEGFTQLVSGKLTAEGFIELMKK